MYTIRLYGWDFYTLVTFWTIMVQKQWCFQTQKGLKPWESKEEWPWRQATKLDFELLKNDISKHSLNDEEVLLNP